MVFTIVTVRMIVIIIVTVIIITVFVISIIGLVIIIIVAVHTEFDEIRIIDAIDINGRCSDCLI